MADVWRATVNSALDHAFVSGIELASDEGDKRDDVHPHEECDAGADRAIHYVVAGEVSHIPGESQRGKEPENSCQRRAAPDAALSLFPIRTEIVECGGDGSGGSEG